MNQTERRKYLISTLLAEEDRYKNIEIPDNENEQKQLLQALFNVRAPKYISEEFIKIQNEYLKETIKNKGVTDYTSLIPIKKNIYLWQGDITTLKCGAIVNAANSGMTGCWQPCHNCIDNCIHTYSGIQLRDYCAKIMEEQGYPEPTGGAKITPAFNLPCKYVIHTVGPIVQNSLTQKHKRQLASCYNSCLKIAIDNNIDSIAFCCISTGVFGFPQEEAAKIAIKTVNEYKNETNSKIDIIFNVFKDEDKKYYEELLQQI